MLKVIDITLMGADFALDLAHLEDILKGISSIEDTDVSDLTISFLPSDTVDSNGDQAIRPFIKVSFPLSDLDEVLESEKALRELSDVVVCWIKGSSVLTTHDPIVSFL